MILHVTYETNNRIIKKTFKNEFPQDLIDSARKHELYKKSHTITFELEDDYGNKCC